MGRTMNILITGVAGLLGSNLARSLYEHNITGIDSLVGGYVDNIPSEINFIKKDCNDLTKEDFKDIEVVVHAACTAHEGLSVFSPKFITDNTYGNSMNVLSCAIQAGVKKFIFTSSMARYGTQDALPFTENMVPKPQDPYGIAKHAFELTLKNLSKTHGIEFVILVPHNVVGQGQNYTDPFRNVAGIMINRMLQGKQPIIYGDGNQKRCFSDIRDIIDPFHKVIFSDVANGEVINIGPDNNFITINELAEEIAFIIGFDLDPIYLDARPSEVRLAHSSADKARKLLDYSTRYELKEILSNMVEWVRQRGTGPFNFNLPVEIKNNLTPKTWVNKDIFNK
jgi:UDP-glucose 4-epimerase